MHTRNNLLFHLTYPGVVISYWPIIRRSFPTYTKQPQHHTSGWLPSVSLEGELPPSPRHAVVPSFLPPIRHQLRGAATYCCRGCPRCCHLVLHGAARGLCGAAEEDGGGLVELRVGRQHLLELSLPGGWKVILSSISMHRLIKIEQNQV